MDTQQIIYKKELSKINKEMIKEVFEIITRDDTSDYDSTCTELLNMKKYLYKISSYIADKIIVTDYEEHNMSPVRALVEYILINWNDDDAIHNHIKEHYNKEEERFKKMYNNYKEDFELVGEDLWFEEGKRYVMFNHNEYFKCYVIWDFDENGDFYETIQKDFLCGDYSSIERVKKLYNDDKERVSKIPVDFGTYNFIIN